MAEAPNPTPEHPQPASDPSMEDILASIRRILSEDEAAPDPAQPGSGYTPKPASMRPDEVLELDHSMMVSEPENAPSHNPGFQPHEPEGAAQAQPAPEQPGAAPGAPEPSKERLVAPEAAAAAAASVGSLVRTLSGRSTAVHRGGPT
ncbi:MAG: hypothetical protein JO110_29550, partial [Acetobacteraceae bacterium]|nr:hypothetical protein [Acetobacteraceae bacterium]